MSVQTGFLEFLVSLFHKSLVCPFLSVPTSLNLFVLTVRIDFVTDLVNY